MQADATRLPVTVRLPLIAAAMIFLVAVASTQTAIFFMTRQADRQVLLLGQVYLDGLSASLLPYAADGDEDGIRATLGRALAFHEGIVDRRLAFVPAAGGDAVQVARDGAGAEVPLPDEIGGAAEGLLLFDDGSVWIWRPLVEGGETRGTVVANLDVSSFEDDRTVIRWGLALFDLVFSGLCAVAGFFMVRRVQRPVTTVARHLYEAAMGMLRPIPDAAVPRGDLQAQRMILAYNAMAHATGERESLLAHMAEQQRQADLGRLTATIAHEVRNPLGGMRTAISTLKRFGDRQDVRADAVSFLDRGVAALEHVVNATLESYRARPEWRPLSRADFDDLRLLVDADARSRAVRLRFDVVVPATVPVAALEVRQALLNLLLNAVRASGPGSEVRLAARVDRDELLVTVRDEGGGLDGGVERAMTGGPPVAEGSGLGVSVVVRMVERLNGRIAIESDHAAGTSITLRFPLRGEEGAP